MYKILLQYIMIDPMLVPTLLSITFGGIVSMISQVQHSRCEEINCLGCNCKRKVPEEQKHLNNKEVFTQE
jgi:hypothetical protein